MYQQIMYPHYNIRPQPHKNRLRPDGFRLGQKWPAQQINHSRNGYLNRSANFPIPNEDHWCETCDRGFRTLELLVSHKQQHQKCNIDGCQFIAHPKVITKHIQMQHSTGLYKKIAKLDNPEDIKKWRDERKRRYPTKENIEKKNAEIKEKIERGEKMGMNCQKGTKLNRREHSMKRKYSHDTNRHNFKRQYQGSKSSPDFNKRKVFDVKNKHQFTNIDNKVTPFENNNKSLKPFAGILNLICDTDIEVRDEIEMNDPIEYDEYIMTNECNETNSSSITEPAVCGALTSLINNYESSEEDFDRETQKKEKKNSENIKTFIESPPNKAKECLKSNNTEKSDDDSGPEESKIVKVITTESNINESTSFRKEPSSIKCSKQAKQQNYNNNTKENLKKFKPKLPSTLLEKLLRAEIRHERNIVLQCIRYIVKNNYFEKTGD